LPAGYVITACKILDTSFPSVTWTPYGTSGLSPLSVYIGYDASGSTYTGDGYYTTGQYNSMPAYQVIAYYYDLTLSIGANYLGSSYVPTSDPSTSRVIFMSIFSGGTPTPANLSTITGGSLTIRTQIEYRGAGVTLS
jgi:hypothetical protein